jgi:hypothetical protein
VPQPRCMMHRALSIWDVIVQGLKHNRTAGANHWLKSTRLGSTVVAFQPIAAASRKSPFRNAGTAALHSADVSAEIIRFQPRPIALAAQPTAGRQTKPATKSLQHSTDSDDNYSHRMLINLLTSAWLAALGTGGYFALSSLVQMPR